MLKSKVFAPHVTFECERQFGAEPGNRGRARISLLIKRDFDCSIFMFDWRRNDRFSRKNSVPTLRPRCCIGRLDRGGTPQGTKLRHGYAVCGDHPGCREEPA